MAALALSACALAGCAQRRPAESWPELVQRLTPGTRVGVIDTRGTEVRGRVSTVSATSLTVLVQDAPRQFDPKDVRQVRRDGDALWNGFAIGAGVGVIGAALPDNRCSGTPPRCDDQQIPGRIAFLALATAAGVSLDALHRDRRTLYGLPGHVTWKVTPTLTPGYKGLSVTIGF